MRKILAVAGTITLASIFVLGVLSPGAFAVSPNSNTKPLCHYDDKGADGTPNTGDEGWERINVNEKALDAHEINHEGPGPDNTVFISFGTYSNTIFIDSIVEDFQIIDDRDEAICEYLVNGANI